MTFFWVRDFGKDIFLSNNCISFIYLRKVDAKTVWNSLEITCITIIIIFLIGLFLAYVLDRWTFLGQGLA